MPQENTLAKPRPNWRDVGIFLALTFGLTFVLDLILYLTVGYGNHPATVSLLQLQMLIPAAVAIALQLFLFRGSAIYRLKERPKWFFYYYLAFFVIYALGAASMLVVPGDLYPTIVSSLLLLLSIGGLVVVVVLRLISGNDEFARAGLSGGKVWQYVVYGLALVLIYGLMTALNAIFGLGQAVDIMDFLQQAAGDQAATLSEVPSWAWLLIVGAQSLLLGPILGLLVAFGEEYGWRGYLQGELIKMGKIPGILLVGIIWGLWHAPIIAMGHNFPGYPSLGIVVMTLYTIGLGFFLGYAVLKTGSVWLAAWLHALNNGVASFLMAMVYLPDDMVFSFGIGLYGLVVWAIVVAGLLILGRREWTTPVAPALEEVEL
jgi:membrane protease YdiL (CAAX protease family)